MKRQQLYRSIISLALITGLLTQTAGQIYAQQQEEYIFQNFNFADCSGNLTIEDVQKPSVARLFDSAVVGNSLMKDTNCAYWVRFRIRNPNNDVLVLKAHFLLQEIQLYVPDSVGHYSEFRSGAVFPFRSRILKHKNPVFLIRGSTDAHYYVRLKANFDLGIVIEVFPLSSFTNHELNQYLYFGIFFGIVAIVVLYNLIIFFVAKEKAYIFYALYILSFGLFALVDWGFLKMLPGNDTLYYNHNFWMIPFALMTISLIMYAKYFLNAEKFIPKMNKILTAAALCRVVISVISLLFRVRILNLPYSDVALLTVPYIAGFLRLRQGFFPARYFLIGFTMLFIGFLIHSFQESRYLSFDALTIASVPNIGIVELICFSLALASRFKMLKKETESAQQQINDYFKETERLKNSVNEELEWQVAERTKALKEANEKLQFQAYAIEKANRILEQDKTSLKQDLITVSKNRVLGREVSFEEFLLTYPDEDACYRFLDELKWAKGFICRKCGNAKFAAGKIHWSRKCSRCNYIETVTSATLFSGVKFPIVKAFYIAFLHVWEKPATVKELSETLKLRPNTCWAFKRKTVEASRDGSVTGANKMTALFLFHSENFE